LGCIAGETVDAAIKHMQSMPNDAMFQDSSTAVTVSALSNLDNLVNDSPGDELGDAVSKTLEGKFVCYLLVYIKICSYVMIDNA
jgi:hypothetical protein